MDGRQLGGGVRVLLGAAWGVEIKLFNKVAIIIIIIFFIFFFVFVAFMPLGHISEEKHSGRRVTLEICPKSI